MRLISLSITLLSSIVLARALGVDGFGIYALALSLLSLIGLPVQMGVPVLVLRETSKNAATEQWGRVQAIWVWATRRILLTTPIALAIGISLIALFSSSKTLQMVLLGATLVPLIALGLSRDAALRGLNYIILGQLSDAIVRPFLTLLLVGSFAFFTQQIVVPQVAMILSVLGATIAFGFGALLLWRKRPSVMLTAKRSNPDPGWERAIWPLAGLSAIQLIGLHVGVVIVGAFGEPADIAHFKIAQSANAMPAIGLSVVSMILAPHISRMHVRGEHGALQRLLAYGAALSLLALLPVATILAIWGDRILSLLYGVDFAASWPILMVLLIGQCANAFFGAVITLMTMTGHERSAFFGIAIGTVTNIIVSLILSPIFGAIGVAIAASVSMIVWNILLWRLAFRLTGLDTTVFGFFREGHSQ